MRFMMLYKPGHETDRRPSQEEMAAMGNLIGEFVKSGVLLATDGLQSSKKGARVKISDGTFSVTDGPFAETKELVGGYAIFQLKSLEEAIEYTKRFLALVGVGETEIRQMQDEPGYQQ